MRAVLLFALGSVAVALEITKESWDEKTAGKTVFIKFFAPWCGHCKTIKPHWDKLMKKFDGHASVLIADADCIAEGKSLCEEVGVEGFPTIKYGDPNDLQDYEGGRDYEGLETFASKELGPKCSPANVDLCDADKKKQIQEFLAMPASGLVSAIEEKSQLLEKAGKDHEALVETLQKQYEESEKKMKATQAEIKESGLGLMKSVKAHRKSVMKEEL